MSKKDKKDRKNSKKGSADKVKKESKGKLDWGAMPPEGQISVNKRSYEKELARLQVYEPVSENPVFSVDFAQPPAGGVRIVGTDNNGNRIGSRVE